MKANILAIVDGKQFKRAEIAVLKMIADACDGYAPDEMSTLFEVATDFRGCSLFGSESKDGCEYTFQFPEVYLPKCVVDLQSEPAVIKEQLCCYIIAIKCCLASRYWLQSGRTDQNVMIALITDAMRSGGWFVMSDEADKKSKSKRIISVSE